ncbi:MAG: hypothetical protein ACJAVR_003925 [Paracoccaceae bacterium]|jgi:hypothetical protein
MLAVPEIGGNTRQHWVGIGQARGVDVRRRRGEQVFFACALAQQI